MSAQMRRRLIDHARRRSADKRGGGAVPTPLDAVDVAASATTQDQEALLTKLDEAIVRLEVEHPRAASVVQLRFIAGLSTEETAAELALSTGTVKRDWAFARAWLSAALDGDGLPT
jgi:RNA polymerase sigma factor (TIGR02999 family)